MNAFEVTMDGMVTITFALTAKAAKWSAIAAAREAGYYDARGGSTLQKWPSTLTVRRVPDYDCLRPEGSGRRCFEPFCL